MLYDMHLHTEFSPDSETPLSAHIAAAERLGLSGICVTDHMDIGAPFREEYGDSPESWQNIDFNAYLRYIAEARNTTKMYLGAGVEVAVAENNLDELRARTEAYDFDFIIASFHFFNGKDPFFADFFEGYELKRLFEDYYASAYRCLCEDVRYSVVGHLTYLYKCPVDYDTDVAYADFPDLFDSIFKRVIETGHGFEINTSSLRKKEKPMPPYDMLKRYRELGGEILTLGSDAHYPEHIAFRFDEVRERLKAIGFRYACRFKDMKPEFYEI